MAKSKSLSTKIPKHIAGVKVPKSIRQSGDKIIDALSHPLIADIAAAALLTAAEALRNNDGVRKAAKGTASKASSLAKGAATLAPLFAAKAAAPAKKAKPKGKPKKKQP